MTIDKTSWGYLRNSSSLHYLSPEEILTELASVVATGGNIKKN